MSNNGLISGSFSSDTTLSTPVAINKGGTGQITAQAALDALAAASGTLVRGDIFTVDSSLNMVRLARGSDNQTMMINGSDVNWETVTGGATVNEVSATLTSDWTTDESSLQEVTGLGVTILNSAGGAVLVSTTITSEISSVAGMVFALYNDGVKIASSLTAFEAQASGQKVNISLGTSLSSDGSTIQLYAYAGVGTLKIRGSTTSYTSSINSIGVA
jgi:hypothetical protein